MIVRLSDGFLTGNTPSGTSLSGPLIGFWIWKSELYRFATFGDKVLIALALIAASGVGISQPAMFIIFGDLTDSFVDGGKYAICDNVTSDSYNENVCTLTILTLTDEELQALNNTEEFYDNQIKILMDDMLRLVFKAVVLHFLLGSKLIAWNPN